MSSPSDASPQNAIDANLPDSRLASVFSKDAIDPETANFNVKLEEILANQPSVHTQPPQVTRANREAGKGPFGPVVLSPIAKTRQLSLPSGEVSVRIFVPENVRGVYLHIHGGGWVLGRAHQSDMANEELARACEMAIVSVDYRLAPENPYPAGPDDCEVAALWLAKNAQAEFGTERLLIGGESAGAHLSAVTLLRMRDRHGYSGFSGANLIYGSYDLTGTPSQRNWGERNLVLNAPIMRWFFDQFVPQAKRQDADVSPLYARLHGMPPALFTVGTLDPLLDDSLFMHSRWLAAGNRSELAVYAGAVHGFTMFPLAVSRRAEARISEFLRQQLVS